MARRRIPIDDRIKAQQEKVDRLNTRYDKELAKLNKLKSSAEEVKKKELAEEMIKSSKTYEEIKSFLEG